jgi:hypothetical protein
MAGLSNATYHNGQLLGSKGLKLITFNKVVINPLSNLGRGIDATIKATPKILVIPQHVGEAIHPGDRFHQAANSHSQIRSAGPYRTRAI